MRVGAVAILCLVLAGCGRHAYAPAEESADAVVTLDMAPPAVARRSEAADTSAGSSANSPANPAAPLIAYSYNDVIWAPTDKVIPLMRLHQKACADAGPVVCQVVSIQQQSRDENAGATLEVRATPAWIAQLHGRLDGDLKAAGGRLTHSELSSEDLTRSIIDGEARLRAQTTLRDRLQKLLAERPGKLAELLEVEQELARVQGEVDSAQSNLAVMRTRVATSSLTLTYQSLRPTPRPTGAWGPLVEALREVQSTLAASLGVLVRVVALSIPWVLAVGLVLWLARKRLPRLPRLRRKPAAADPPKPD